MSFRTGIKDLVERSSDKAWKGCTPEKILETILLSNMFFYLWKVERYDISLGESAQGKKESVG